MLHRRSGPPFSYDVPQLATEAPLVRGFFAARALMKCAPTRRGLVFAGGPGFATTQMECVMTESRVAKRGL